MNVPEAIRQILRILLLLLLTSLVGTLGFHLIEGWSLFDSLYMAVITLTTVGYAETYPLSTGGRSFVIVYLIVGLGLTFYGFARMGEVLIKTQIFTWLGRRRMDSEVQNMSGHYIVCGYGRMGKSLVSSLQKQGIKVVAIEKDEGEVEAAPDGIIILQGDGTDDDQLMRAGIARARGIAVVFGEDARNLFVVMTARLLNPSLQIIARAGDERSVSKFHKAGANRVVSPYHAGASKMARLLLSPGVSDVFDRIPVGEEELELAQVRIEADSPLLNTSVADTDFAASGVVIVGVSHADGTLALPPGKTPLQVGDSLMAMGRSASINKFCGID